MVRRRDRRRRPPGRSGDAPGALRSYRAAIELYVGDLALAALVDHVVERERLRARYLSLRARLADALFAVADYSGALDNALDLLAHDPCREDAHRMAMRSYVRLGQRAQALRQYTVCRSVLAREFDAPPEPLTEALFDLVRLGPTGLTFARRDEVRPIGVDGRVPRRGVRSARPARRPSCERPRSSASRRSLDGADALSALVDPRTHLLGLLAELRVVRRGLLELRRAEQGIDGVHLRELPVRVIVLVIATIRSSTSMARARTTCAAMLGTGTDDRPSNCPASSGTAMRAPSSTALASVRLRSLRWRLASTSPAAASAAAGSSASMR